MNTRTWTSGNVIYGPMDRNLIRLELMERLLCGVRSKKNFNQHALYQEYCKSFRMFCMERSREFDGIYVQRYFGKQFVSISPKIELRKEHNLSA